MARQTRPLTNTEVKNVKPSAKPIKLFDGGGLFLLVNPGGSKGWRFKYRFNDKEKLISFGPYPDVSLSAARKQREHARTQIIEGIDPSEFKKSLKQTQDCQKETLEVIAREWLEKFGQTWEPTHTKRKLRRMENDVFPALGSKQINDITAPQVLTMLRRIEARGALSTAHTIRSILGQVFRYAVATGRAERDPTADLKGALPPTVVKHRPAITDPKKLAPLLKAIEGYDGQFTVKCALKILPYVFTRPGELRQAEWSEFDLDGGEWHVPAGRMKMRNPHLVPLSNQVVATLRELYEITGFGTLLFPSIRSTAKPISDNTLNAALRRMGYTTDEVTAHGFRATARTLLEEVLHFPPEYIEQQLAHAVKDPLGRAYNRTKHLTERKKMMQAWANYLDGLKAGAEVIPLFALNGSAGNE